MAIFNPKRRAIYVLLFFFIISCQSKESTWLLKKDGALSKSLVFPSKDPNFGLELQISSLDQYFSLSVMGREIPPYKQDSKKALLYIENENIKKSYIVHRLDGGQKLVLPNDLSQIIIAELEKGKNISIKTGTYSQNIDSKKFAQLFKKL